MDNLSKQLLTQLIHYPCIIYKNRTCIYTHDFNNSYLSRSKKSLNLINYSNEYIHYQSHKSYTMFFYCHAYRGNKIKILLIVPLTFKQITHKNIQNVQKTITLITKILEENQIPLYHKESKLSSSDKDIQVDISNNTYVEQLIIRFLKNEDSKSAYSLIRQLSGSSKSVLSANSLQSNKYKLVCFITLITRSAIFNGYSIKDSYDLSDKLINEVDELYANSQLDSFIKKMLKSYTLCFRENKKVNTSHIIKLANEYIEHHIYDKITVKEISDYIGVSYPYLSALFKKEVNINLKNFIQQKKIEESKFLLCNTSLSVSEISYKLGFCNQSYFTKTFKAFTKTSPIYYRNNKNYIVAY
ncbi:MAG: AraC family transcriptional regulator [Liquorilactobacillus nagelii]|uniref:AraC family transcriptional regulator n=1 Tax=Liquorilactobacillus nagelii TaxID=82688 RepID=UPI0039E94E85